ncbi:unnamed protein product [Rotaria magnacalcarata]|uniref:Uncharacterized protein n=3 Tax=Rotaria magnacalcarata TaxID=392030 RepID=A0A815YZK3_9BILA|nr:unnamed protein product [Rotaria magnacalcarata]CAF1577970.1 unnamed protein product [Rotaria magnacalcarata]CAF4027117.1 unnamed protein product [Rotaria magnacalcarata]CAF4067913.1 unnamed protein product [Rotaria magnacalcarata]
MNVEEDLLLFAINVILGEDLFSITQIQQLNDPTWFINITNIISKKQELSASRTGDAHDGKTRVEMTLDYFNKYCTSPIDWPNSHTEKLQKSLHDMKASCDKSQMGKLKYNIDNITFIEPPYVHAVASSCDSDEVSGEASGEASGELIKYPPYHIDCLNMNRYSSIDWSRVTPEQRAAYEEAKNKKNKGKFIYNKQELF